jgi:hypothetical protein
MGWKFLTGKGPNPSAKTSEGKSERKTRNAARTNRYDLMLL